MKHKTLILFNTKKFIYCQEAGIFDKTVEKNIANNNWKNLNFPFPKSIV